MQSGLLKPLLLVAIVLAMPLAIVLAWGELFWPQIERWQADPPGPWPLAMAVVAILASDVFLPVPSGPVSALAGAALGAAWGTAASTVGMTIGAAIAFGLARRWGRPLAAYWSSPQRLADMEGVCRDHGLWMLALTRPLPILAEACALLVGALRMSWARFLPVVLGCNVVISACYALLGEQAAANGWLPWALGIAAAAPLAIAVVWRKRLSRRACTT